VYELHFGIGVGGQKGKEIAAGRLRVFRLDLAGKFVTYSGKPRHLLSAVPAFSIPRNKLRQVAAWISNMASCCKRGPAISSGRGGGRHADWQAITTLNEMPRRERLWLKVRGQRERTTPYELTEHFRFSRFVTVDLVEASTDTHIMREGDVVALEAA